MLLQPVHDELLQLEQEEQPEHEELLQLEQEEQPVHEELLQLLQFEEHVGTLEKLERRSPSILSISILI